MTKLPTCTVAPIFLFLLAFAAGENVKCGGELSGFSGYAVYKAPEDAQGSVYLNCIWVLHPEPNQRIRFTLKHMSSDTTLQLYPKLQEEPFRSLTAQYVGSSYDLGGSQLFLILPFQSGAEVEFQWDPVVDGEDGPDFESFTSIFQPRNSTFTVPPNGNITGRITELISFPSTHSMILESRPELVNCQQTDPCDCFSTTVFQVGADGRLGNISRSCDTATISPTLSQVFVLILFDTTDGSQLKIVTECTAIEKTTTTTTSTTPKPDSAISFAVVNKWMILCAVLAQVLWLGID